MKPLQIFTIFVYNDGLIDCFDHHISLMFKYTDGMLCASACARVGDKEREGGRGGTGESCERWCCVLVMVHEREGRM